MDKGNKEPMKPEITLSDVMDEIKDLVEVVDIIHSTDTVNFASGTETGGGNPDYPQSGFSVAGVAGSVTRGGTGEIYRIASFGHSELTNSSDSTGTSSDPVTYQIWVDGKLFMEWQNFQWSAVTVSD